MFWWWGVSWVKILQSLNKMKLEILKTLALLVSLRGICQSRIDLLSSLEPCTNQARSLNSEQNRALHFYLWLHLLLHQQKRIRNTFIFIPPRSRQAVVGGIMLSDRLSILLYACCPLSVCLSRLRNILWSFIQSGINFHLDSSINWLDFRGQRSMPLRHRKAQFWPKLKNEYAFYYNISQCQM